MNIGTHQTHCCIIHGCKYGDEDCPVVTGKVVQTYFCEDWDNISTNIRVEEISNEWYKFFIGKVYIGTIQLGYNGWIAQTVNGPGEYPKQFTNVFLAMKQMHEWLLSEET
jgi:hypothetical protein